MSQKLPLVLERGRTFSEVLLCAGEPFVYKAITAITRAAPARLTVTGHGIPDGWPVAPVSVLGMTQINAELDSKGQPKASSYLPATVVDTDTIELNTVNSAGFSAYTSSGYLQFYTPTDLSAAIVRCVIKDRQGGTILQTLTSVASAGVIIDDTAKTITLTLSAAAVTALTWSKGWHETEIEIAGQIDELAEGPIVKDRAGPTLIERTRPAPFLIATGPRGLPGTSNALPGGTTGQLRAKASNTDFDEAWIDPPESLPTGGTAGQILTKQSSTDGDAAWDDPAATGATGAQLSSLMAFAAAHG